MSLVYLVTGLPPVIRGEAPQIGREEFVARCRDLLTGNDRVEFERLVQIESVEESVRIDLSARLEGADADIVVSAMVNDRRDGVSREDLPDWLLRPAPQHILLRRHYHEVTEHATTAFLRGWANFRVDIGEVVTAVLCRLEGMSRDLFMEQMQGSFDASAPLIVRHWDDPNLGLGQRFPWLPEVLTALADDDLVAMSRKLDDIAWRQIDVLRPQVTFCVETVMATYLQLRIAEREAGWDAVRGAEVLDRILALSASVGTQGAGKPAKGNA